MAHTRPLKEEIAPAKPGLSLSDRRGLCKSTTRNPLVKDAWDICSDGKAREFWFTFARRNDAPYKAGNRPYDHLQFSTKGRRADSVAGTVDGCNAIVPRAATRIRTCCNKITRNACVNKMQNPGHLSLGQGSGLLV
jgi:hypothetical protein